MKRETTLLALIFGCMILSSCGNRGELVLEPGKHPQPVKDLALRQKGTAIELEFSFPARWSDNSTLIELERISRVFVFRADSTVGSDRFAKAADQHAKIPYKELQHRDGRTFAIALPFKPRELKDKKHLFAVQYEYGKKRSEMGNVATISTMIPPRPASDLALVQEKKTLVLQWSRPEQDIGKQPLAQPPGFHVYRCVTANDREPPAWRRLTSVPLQRPAFEDSDLSLEGEYAYAVTAVLSPQVESDFSNRVRQKIADTFPPDTPQQLVAFSGPDIVLLTWEPVPDTDLSYYRVYRKDKEDGQLQIIADNIKENQYKDAAVKKGQTYFYVVTAVDRRGNESEPTRTVGHDYK